MMSILNQDVSEFASMAAIKLKSFCAESDECAVIEIMRSFAKSSRSISGYNFVFPPSFNYFPVVIFSDLLAAANFTPPIMSKTRLKGALVRYR
jgi:hypothetical protein